MTTRAFAYLDTLSYFKQQNKSKVLANFLAKKLLSDKNLRAFESCNYDVVDHEEISESLNRHLLNGGKRFRAILAYLVWELFSDASEDSRANVIARASEHVHAAFLSHDDVIDQAQERRGQLSFNQVVGNRLAVLAGDSLLSKVMLDVSSLGSIKLMQALSLCISKTVEGEIWQNNNRWNASVGMNDVLNLGSQKTGALFSWTASAPAILHNMPEFVVERLNAFANLLGVLFQMADDALDFTLESEKEYAKDLKEGLVNSATLSLLECYPHLRMDLHLCFSEKKVSRFWSEDQWVSASELHSQKIAHHVAKATHEITLLRQSESLNQKSVVFDKLEYLLSLAATRKV